MHTENASNFNTFTLLLKTQMVEKQTLTTDEGNTPTLLHQNKKRIKSVTGIQHGLQPTKPRLGSSSSTHMLRIIYKNKAQLQKCVKQKQTITLVSLKD